MFSRFGRKKCFLYQTIGMGVFGMLPALAVDPWTYLVARYLAGFGGGGKKVSSRINEHVILSYGSNNTNSF